MSRVLGFAGGTLTASFGVVGAWRRQLRQHTECAYYLSMAKPKILIQLDTDAQPSVFDAIVAIDAGADQLLRHGGVEPVEVRELVYGGMFTRSPGDLSSTAVFIGGSNVEAAEAILAEVRKTYFGPLRMSVLLDASGAEHNRRRGRARRLEARPAGRSEGARARGDGTSRQPRRATLASRERQRASCFPRSRPGGRRMPGGSQQGRECLGRTMPCRQSGQSANGPG